MKMTQTLDHEALVERAEAVRFWLLGFSLSSRASGAIQRELGAIIAEDSAARPLAGLTVADFVSELHSPSGGAVGRVKSVGDAVLKELRAAIPADTYSAAPVEAAASAETADEAPWAEYELPVEEPAPAQERTEAPAAPEVAEPQADAPEAVAPKRRGRPRRAVAPEPPPGEDAAPKRRPGRPRREVASPNGAQPATTRAAQAEVAATLVAAEHKAAPSDPTLDQLRRLWPSLHPHARRAVVLYASDMLIEAS